MKRKKKKEPGFTRFTVSGLALKEVYTSRDGPTGNRVEELPGSYPFTRGIHSSMYRGKLWTMRQYAGFGTAKEANKRYRYLLEQGTTGLSVAFDLPTQMGRDSDHSLAVGEVGKVGVAISTVNDMDILLQGIPLQKVSVSMTINATAAILLAFLLVVAERQKTPWNLLTGTIQNDILKEYIARGTYIYPPGPALRIVIDVFEFCAREVPLWNTVSISGYHMREAGSTASQEIGFTLANAIQYVESALERGLKIDSFAPRLAFFFNCHNDFFEEICKFRAARRLWAKLMKTRFKAKDARSLMMRFHTQTAGSSLTAQQPLNNVVRTSTQALAAVLGGTQSLHTNGFDEALSLPTEESATLALRTQQIIAFESGVANVVDPLGGSYFIEKLTDRLEEEAVRIIDKVEGMGGMVSAIEARYPQEQIETAAYEYQQTIESGDKLIVGVNKFAVTNERETKIAKIAKIDLKGEREQRKRLALMRASRNPKITAECLRNLQSAAKSASNVVPAIIEAARRDVTLGEISDIFREAFGEYDA